MKSPMNGDILSPRRGWAGWVLALALGLLGLWQFHRTEWTSGFDQVPGGRGDNRYVVSILEYLYQAHRGVGQYFSPYFYFPARDTLGYSDAYLTHAFLYGWLRNLGWDIFSSYQFCVFVFNLLNYLFCLLMLRSGFKFGTVPSALGAFLFAFNAPKFNQVAHTQLQCLFWLPLALWLVVVWVRNRRRMVQVDSFFLLAGAALALDTEFSTSFYPAWFLAFWVCLFMALNLSLRTTRVLWKELVLKFWKALAGAFAVGIAGLIPFLSLYLPVYQDLGGKSFDEAKTMIPRPLCFLWMGPDHGLWGWLRNVQFLQNLPIEGEERIGFGVVILAGFWGLTFWAIRRLFFSPKSNQKPLAKNDQNGKRLPMDGRGLPSLDLAALAALATILFCLLGCQYGDGFSPWYWIYRWVPGGQSIRAVARYAIALALPLSVLAAFTIQMTIERTSSLRKGASRLFWLGGAFLAGGLMVSEQVLLPPCPGFSKGAELARLEYLSRKLPGGCMTFYAAPAPSLPLVPDYSSTNLQIDAMLISAVRGIPTFNGYSGHSPRDWGLFKLRSPYYPQYVKDWMDLNHFTWPVERLEIDR
jgi:hypothetical protein